MPVASTQLPDHPRLTLDSLHEQADAPVPGLTHRYSDKALFLPLDICPVYCRFCTRSYAVGVDTDTVQKARLKPDPKRWHPAFAYIASRPELEDIVVSGGDVYMLPAKQLSTIGHLLLAIPNIRRIRFATKGPAVMPKKILTDEAWTDALSEVAKPAASCTRRSASTRTSTTRTRSPRSRARRWRCCSSAASPCATRPCCSAASTTRSRR